jgi:TatD DNase family protein
MKLDLIDIHAHVNFNAFKDDGDEVIKRTLDRNIGMILVGSQYDTSKRAIEYAARYEHGVWASVGLHPIHLVEYRVDSSEVGGGAPGFKSRPEVFDYDKYKKLATRDKVVAIGECGLDYFRTGDSDSIRKNQHETFRAHVRLARELNKPLIIHCRDAYEDLHKILIEEKGGDVGGTIHFFAGTWTDAQKFLALGFHLSFTGVLTFARDYDETVKQAPLERIMVETDAPYVAPAPFRGKRNEPIYVKEIAKKMAEIRGIPYEELATATTENATRLFGLDEQLCYE